MAPSPSNPHHSPGNTPGNTPGNPGNPGTPNTPGQQSAPNTPPQTPANNPPQQATPVPVAVHTVTTTPAPAPQPTPDNANQQPGANNNDGSNKDDDSKSEPTPASSTRDNTPPGGVNDPSRAEQNALENSVPRDENGDPTRPPNPNDGDWVERINGDGRDAPGRSNNCVDTALSTVDTYAGNPTAAGARTPDLDADGNPSDRGERGGRDRIENTLGARFSDMGNGRDAYNRLENTLRNSGHGSQAVIITQDANGRAHAWNAVNHNGKITYIDAQTGQRSPHPLHSGKNGVFAIPLDSDRRAIPAGGDARGSNSGQRGNTSSTPAEGAGRPPENDPARTDRRAPDEPAGQSSETQDPHDSWKDEGDGEGTKDSGQSPPPQGSTPYDQQQSADHQHYGVLGDPAQQGLRDRDVRQIDLDPVYDFLDDLANNNNDRMRELLQGNEDGRPWPRDAFAALPGFEDLSRGQQLAAVGALARLSNDFHRNQGVGSSPHPRAGDESAYEWSEDTEREAHRKRDIRRQQNFPGVENIDDSRGAQVHANAKRDFSEIEGSNNKSSSPAERTRHHLDETYGESVAQQVAESTRDLKPNFTGRNFAVIEVVDPHNGERHYVADSSFSHAGPRPDHSEPHLGGWMERLNEDRASEGKKPFDIVHMYTEREPCGDPSNSPGHADCSGYITSYLPENMRVDYGFGYRKGEQVGEFNDPREGVTTPRQAMEADAQHHLNRLSDILKAYAFPTPTSASAGQ
ncbi:toxin glutamine deamidase domain-containing protein [Streptomyces sp. Da 82-17]|uniref:toxin glutamine deamidase domain-containing protein n=1 Tax=Streptomyces sp. Da 82-17 TaxID=3377116 RepID=UPI0038D4348C